MTTTRLAALAAAIALPLLAGCQDGTGPGDPIVGTAPSFDRGVRFEATDTALLVDGQARHPFTGWSRAVRFNHNVSYEYGGLGSYAPDRLWDEFWMITFSHETRSERGDTAIYTYHDFGDVSLGGETLIKHTDEPDWSHAPHPVKFEGFAIYLHTPYVHSVDLDGRPFEYAPTVYFDDLVTGTPVPFQATGGSTAHGFDVDVAIEPLPALTGVLNPDPLPFETERPRVRAGEGLVLTFAEPVDPARSFFALVPWHEEGDPATLRSASAVGQLEEATDRVLFPHTLLTDLLDRLGTDDAGYLVFVIRWRETGDAITTTTVDRGEVLTMPVVQRDDVRFMLRLTR